MNPEPKEPEQELYPAEFVTYSPEIQRNVQAFLRSLTPMQRKAYRIARIHLGTSFDILRCNGYVAFCQQSHNNNTPHA